MPRHIIRTKVAVVGDAAVGKTALTKSFLTDGREYPKNYEMTFGVDLFTKMVPIPDTNDAVELFIYDSSGQPYYEQLLPKYWDGANMFVVVMDVTNPSSARSVPTWTDMVRSQGAVRADAIRGVLVANKIDLEARRAIGSAEGRELAAALQLEYVECSAKDNKAVTVPFEMLALNWHRMFTEKIASFHMIS
ncbi:Intraflagellar transport protein 27-like protein [Frankliniella fusca]|uniref:Intraflagellar transport protein 27-like protein n=1 Tax=Frankliniella fusca TaxID=407009 RepID=A0AAE1HUT2_9NEOP|nr:Intraflagellar transport protein 27-like protein [Frankliniella fusca]